MNDRERALFEAAAKAYDLLNGWVGYAEHEGQELPEGAREATDELGSALFDLYPEEWPELPEGRTAYDAVLGGVPEGEVIPGDEPLPPLAK